MEVRIGTVTSYFERIGVAVIELEDTLHVSNVVPRTVATIDGVLMMNFESGEASFETDAHVRRGTLVYRKS